MKRILWESQIDIDDYKDFLEEEHPDVIDDYEKWQLCIEENNIDLDCEKTNLKKEMPILCIANLGFWNGRKYGFRLLKDFKDIFQTYSDGEVEFYVEDGDVKATEWHHDNTNYYTFYEIRQNRMNTKGFEQFLEDVKSDDVEISKSRISYYCKHLGYWPKEVYGWQ